jgi:hypothetical protein
MRHDFEMAETWDQFFCVILPCFLIIPCLEILGYTEERIMQITMFFVVVSAIFFSISSLFICLRIKHRLWEKTGRFLRYFHFVFTVITTIICLFFLAVVFVLWLASLILA